MYNYDRRAAANFNKTRVDEYMKMVKKVEQGRAEQWQATELFKKMTGPDMDEIVRRKNRKNR